MLTLPAAPLCWVSRCHCQGDSRDGASPSHLPHPLGPRPLEQARGLAAWAAASLGKEMVSFRLCFCFFFLIQLGVILRGFKEESSLQTSLLSGYAVHAGGEKDKYWAQALGPERWGLNPSEVSHYLCWLLFPESCFLICKVK